MGGAEQHNPMDGFPDSEAHARHFCEVAGSQGLLDQKQVNSLLKRHRKAEEQGLEMRIDRIAVERGILKPAECLAINRYLREQKSTVRKDKKKKRPVAENELQLPCRFGPYEVKTFLGGHMGAVYKAWDPRQRLWVALKILPQALKLDAEMRNRFGREARAAKSVAHPNLVRFLDTGRHAERQYIAMEFIDGESIAQRIERKWRLSERSALKATRAIGCGLHHLHAHGIIHRDLKPANVMIDTRGRVRVADLGLAKLLSDHHSLTATGLAVGTPAYMAPEMAMALPDIDQRADIYALGLCLFEMLCGAPAFKGNIGEVMRSQIEDDVPDPRTIDREISRATASLVWQMTRKDPDERPRYAAIVVGALDRLLQGPRFLEAGTGGE